jgi:hypothetical protein
MLARPATPLGVSTRRFRRQTYVRRSGQVPIKDMAFLLIACPSIALFYPMRCNKS